MRGVSEYRHEGRSYRTNAKKRAHGPERSCAHRSCSRFGTPYFFATVNFNSFTKSNGAPADSPSPN